AQGHESHEDFPESGQRALKIFTEKQDDVSEVLKKAQREASLEQVRADLLQLYRSAGEKDKGEAVSPDMLIQKVDGGKSAADAFYVEYPDASGAPSTEGMEMVVEALQTLERKLETMETNTARKLETMETNTARRLETLETNTERRLETLETNTERRLETLETNTERRPLTFDDLHEKTISVNPAPFMRSLYLKAEMAHGEHNELPNPRDFTQNYEKRCDAMKAVLLQRLLQSKPDKALPVVQ
ncbi:unnamed protein product, partial [Cladocopium goreaui]